MRFLLPVVLLPALSAPVLTQAQQSATPPAAKVSAVSSSYFGTTVTDPYHWMEAGTTDPEFTAFLHAQNDHTQSVLSSLKGRDAILKRIHELGNVVPHVGGWQRGGDSIFYLQTNPGASTASLMMRDASGRTKTLLDPVTLEQNQSHAAINYFVPSWDGKYVAVGVSLGGSEDATLHVIEAATGRLLPDAITRTQYANPSWRRDSKSFFYARLQSLDPGAPPTAVYENEHTLLHVIGSDPEKDAVAFGTGVASSPDIPKAGFTGITVTPGSKYDIAFYSAGTVDPPALYIAPAKDADTAAVQWKKIATAADVISPGADSPVAVRGSTLYLLVDKDAPNRKLIATDLDHPNIGRATVLVPPSDDILLGIYAAQDGLYLTSKQGVRFKIRRAPYSKEPQWKEIPLPAQGTISGLDASVEQTGVIFGLDSWTQSFQAFKFDPASGTTSNTGLVPSDPADFSKVEAREVTVRSADGTQVPLSIICRKGIALDGSHPVWYEGYGAYGISLDPFFDSRMLAWIEQGGIYGYVHVRGGGEFGEAWHNAGRKETKQHTIDDMVAAAQYLIAQGYTSPQHLAVMGTSAGGIAVGGAIVQHPELFAAAIDNVGMTDLLHFQNTQGGAANVPEFGDVTDPAGFKALYAVSPYEHVVAGARYPAVLAITGVNDPRVPTWIVAEMAARLQAANASQRPILLRVDFDAGHGLGSSRPQRERLLADIMSFILWQSGDPEFQPSGGNAASAHR